MTELNELEDGYDFGLAGAEVMVVSCPDLPVNDFGGRSFEEAAGTYKEGIPVFPMDLTDSDGNWTVGPGASGAEPGNCVAQVLALQARRL